MKIPFVKEWGSWVVFTASCLAGLIAGLLMRPWDSGRIFGFQTVLTVVGIALLINSKNALGLILRSKTKKREHIIWFLVFVISGLAFLYPFLKEGLRSFYICSVLVVSYLVMLGLEKEHSIITELNGFALLTLSAPIVYFSVTGHISLKLYAVVLIYFAAGVFKVRMRLKKTLFYRIVMILYCAGAVASYYALYIPVVLLFPLMENISCSLWPRNEKLRTTGNIEMAKSMIFIVLISMFWQ